MALGGVPPAVVAAADVDIGQFGVLQVPLGARF